MLTDPINMPGKNLAPAAIARLPSGKSMPEKNGATPGEDKAADLSRMTDLVADTQKRLNMISNVDLQFSVHEASGKVMVTVMDGATGEVIREIPPSEVLDLAARVDEMIGLIFDKKG